jgi:hypothetical protein
VQAVARISAEAPPVIIFQQKIFWWSLSAAREVQETLDAIFLFKYETTML